MQHNLAIEHCSRVHGIAVRNPIAELLSNPFPELESLEIHLGFPHNRVLTFSAAFLSGSALPSLRRLTLRGVAPSCLPPLLSLTISLVGLNLTLDMPPEASLFANLRCLSCLRRLELKLCYRSLFTIYDSPPPSPSVGDIVTLSKLTDLIFIAPSSYMRILVDRLAAPSLQHLDAEVRDKSCQLLIPHLRKFICSTKFQFIAVRLDIMSRTLAFYAETCSKSGHWHMFSGPLSTVEELVVECHVQQKELKNHTQWRGFFNHIQRVKMIQVSFEVALDVACSFQPNGQQAALDLLPALEKVEVNIRLVTDTIDQRVSIRDAFEPLIAARQQVGRPIMLSYYECPGC
ncbi:hypothetical protein EI94DRAFT_1720848 [Lactarius quietus]|nr:hypothetical protein EI94DRAFT_1720848 [Lactarius quietus]